MFNIC